MTTPDTHFPTTDFRYPASDLRPPTSAHFLIDPPASGPWNMAVDEALLNQAANEDQLTLRFYQWEEPTLSLGYFQRYADRDRHEASLKCPVVRRQSGGGAILHDRELTYSLAIPRHHPLAQNTQGLYRAIHQSLVDLFRDWQVAAHVNETPSELAPEAEPFLCFARRAVGDVFVVPADGGAPVGSAGKRSTANGPSFKIVGSAQRRHRGAVLQHGSILLAQSEAAPELPGLAEVSGRVVSAEELLGSWQDRVFRLFPHPLEPARLPQSVQAAAGRICESRYGTGEWTKRR